MLVYEVADVGQCLKGQDICNDHLAISAPNPGEPRCGGRAVGQEIEHCEINIGAHRKIELCQGRHRDEEGSDVEHSSGRRLDHNADRCWGTGAVGTQGLEP